jgi:predicted dehydrogenase
MDKVRLGIIGVGGMGKAHFESARKIEGLEVTALCDVDPSRIAFFDGPKFADPRELIRSGRVDAILVATPHYFHTPIAIDGLNQGLHVLTEKPVAVHVNDAKKMIAAHRDKKQVFAIMFQQRTYPAHVRLKQMIASGEMGPLRRVSWIITDWFRTEAYYASGGWRATWSGEGGGVLLNQCPHNLDLLQWFTGMPSRVSAVIGLGKYHNIEVEDEVTAVLEYPNGATGVFVTTTAEAPGTNRLELAFDNGRVILENQRISVLRNETPVSTYLKGSDDKWGRPASTAAEYDFTGDVGEQHAAVLRSFKDAILKGTPLVAAAEEGLNSLSLGNAMLLSGLLGKPVDLPLNGNLFEKELKRLVKKSRFVKAPAMKNVKDDISKSF